MITFDSFLGTGPHRPQLISWTLASLLFTLLTYTVLEAMSGDALHVRVLFSSAAQNSYLLPTPLI